MTAGILVSGVMAEDLCQDINFQTRDALGETHTSSETLAFGEQIKKEKDERSSFACIQRQERS